MIASITKIQIFRMISKGYPHRSSLCLKYIPRCSSMVKTRQNHRLIDRIRNKSDVECMDIRCHEQCTKNCQGYQLLFNQNLRCVCDVPQLQVERNENANKKWIIQLLYDPRWYYVDILPPVLKHRIAHKSRWKREENGLHCCDIIFFIGNVVPISLWYFCSIRTKGDNNDTIIIVLMSVIPNHGHY